MNEKPIGLVKMHIKSIQKTTLIDYPGHVAATIFLGGCNFRCDYCYNKDLVYRWQQIPDIPEQQVLDAIQARKNFIEGVVITGGEPTLNKDLKDFILKIRDMDLLVKLDTNGYKPEVVADFINEKIVDYFAIDVKAPLMRYAEITGVKELIADRIAQSIKLLKNSGIAYEFRTTVWKDGFSQDDFRAIFELIKGSQNYYIQNMYPVFTIEPKQTYAPMRKSEIAPILRMGKKYVENIQLRGDWM